MSKKHHDEDEGDDELDSHGPGHGKKKGKGKGHAPSGHGGSASGWIVKTSILAAIWGCIFVGLFLSYCALDLPDIRQIAQASRRPSITLEADDGSVFARYGDLYGEPMNLEELPAYVPEAVIAIEDRRFYDHFGVDLWGILRAALRNAVEGHLVQGGSTITQQLAKNLFLTPARTIKRKMQEMMLAVWMERTYSKQQILTAYLNRVYLGAGAWGIDAAAHTYFGKSARELNLREAAIIAGLLRAPSRLAPTRDAAQAMERAKMVLRAMEDEGYISEEQMNAAVGGEAPPDRKPGPSGDGRYFADWVAEQVAPMALDVGQDIVVRTTLNLNMERLAERHLESVLDEQGQREVTQGALVTLAPDGAIKTLVGGRNYRVSQFNRATQAMRQPGSAFKPFVYLAAIENGLSPDDIVQDEPLRVGRWTPENFDGKYRGPVSAREALAESLNTVAVRVFLQAGAEKVIDTARALGITSPLIKEPALALGASEVTPLELAGAYASIAAGGRAVEPYAVQEVRNRNGQILYSHPEVSSPSTVSSSAVETLVGMMEEVVRNGTGRRAALGSRPVAGKTGTSSEYRDAWFIGFTADYTSAVWLGNDDNHPMRKVIGGNLPAQIWHNYMAEVEANLPERALLSGGGIAAWTGAITEDISSAFGSFVDSILGGGSERAYPGQARR